MDRPTWIDAFVMHLSRRGVKLHPASVVRIAETVYEQLGRYDPATAAEATWAMNPALRDSLEWD